MFFNRVMQPYRKSCKNAIGQHYCGSADLMADRIDKHTYYSVWHVGEKLLEVTHDGHGKISIYEFLPAQ